MNSHDYWAKREAEALKHYVKDEKAYDKQLKKIYNNMLDACQNEINAFYGRYSSREGITIAEAKKRVSKLDIEAYERKAKRYVKEKDFSAEANEEMRLYNLTMKVNRLEMLKANIGLELIAGHDELQKFMAKILKGRTEEELKRQAGILGKTIRDNAKTAEAIVNASFHNAAFSDRVWLYQDLLKNEMDKLLQSGLIQGKNPRVLARELRKTFKTSEYNAERLMRTELARVQTDAQKKSFERNGFEQYTFIVNGGCCPVCEEIKGKHFKVAKMMPGENAPPMHPHCRCSVAAYEDSAEYDAWLDFLDKGGTTAEWEKMKAQQKTKSDDLTNRRKERLAARKAQITTVDFETMDKNQLATWAKDNLKTTFGDVVGANTDFVREAVKVIAKLEEKMGGKTISDLRVQFGGTPTNVCAKYDDKTKTVKLKKSGSLNSFSQSLKENNEKSLRKLGKRYNATETFAGAIWHELGHAVDIDTGQALSAKLSTKNLDEKSVKISVYAGSSQNVRVTKRSEAWAENFAAYMSGENANEVPVEIVEMIEDYFKKKRS